MDKNKKKIQKIIPNKSYKTDGNIMALMNDIFYFFYVHTIYVCYVHIK